MTRINSCKIGENPFSPSKTFDCAEFIVEELKSWTTQRVTRFYLGSELGSIFRFIDLSGLAALNWRRRLEVSPLLRGHWRQLNSGVSCKGGQERTSRSPWHLFDRCPLRLGHQLATLTLALYSREPLPIVVCRTYFAKKKWDCTLVDIYTK